MYTIDSVFNTYPYIVQFTFSDIRHHISYPIKRSTSYERFLFIENTAMAFGIVGNEQKNAYKTFGKLFNNSKQNFHLFPTKIKKNVPVFICSGNLSKVFFFGHGFFSLRHAFPLSFNNKQNHRKQEKKLVFGVSFIFCSF